MNNLVRRSVAAAPDSSAPVALHGGFWVRLLCRLLAGLYFGRPRIFGRVNLPADTALLASNHRAGAIDGMLLRRSRRAGPLWSARTWRATR
jgi:1-acyl-sn-glycerol-3-phosphate acyltransferase